MRYCVGPALVLVAGCLDRNPVFVEPQGTAGASEGDETTATPPTTAGPTTTPPTTTPPTTDPPTTTDSATSMAPATDSGVGDSESTLTPDTESTSTTMPPGECGDGQQNPDEQCDDGNQSDDDMCLSDCTEASCGDGIVWKGKEECDDGNADETDDCLNTCVMASCGDTHVWKGKEECDDGNAIATDACVTCKAAKCGDGKVWMGNEECDDGNNVGNDGCEPVICKKTVKLVFVSSVTVTGNMGGIQGAHDLCEMLAMQANLPAAPYRAWLSDNMTSPGAFMLKSPYPYIKTNGEMVAMNWQGLTSGNLLTPIDRDENGQMPPKSMGGQCGPTGVFTATQANGGPFDPMTNCTNWKSDTGYGKWGDRSATDFTWSEGCGYEFNCSYEAPIYCIQQ